MSTESKLLSEAMNVRWVAANGTTYIRSGDIAEVLRYVAYGEETDTRNRLLRLANSLERMSHEP